MPHRFGPPQGDSLYGPLPHRFGQTQSEYVTLPQPGASHSGEGTAVAGGPSDANMHSSGAVSRQELLRPASSLPAGCKS